MQVVQRSRGERGTHGVEDRGLRADRQHATPRRSCRAADRSTGCARRASIRTRASRRWSATTSTAAGRCARRWRCARTRQRYRGDTHDAGDRVRLRRRRRPHHRLHADGRRALRPRPHRRGRSRARCRWRCCSTSASATAPTRRWIEMTRDGVAVRGRAGRAGPARAGRAAAQDGRRVGLRCRSRKGDRIPLQLTWYPSHEQPPARAGRRPGARVDRLVLARLGGPLHLPGAVARRGRCARCSR